jgi:DNA polymerase-3 subunit delta'
MNRADPESIPQILPWHTGQWTDWQRQLDSGRVPHAVLLSGLPGLGKGRLAKAFARAVLCGDPQVRPCSRCKSCRLLATGNHPDLRIIQPEAAGKGIKIDQVRALVEFLAGTAQQGGWKCAVIDPADALNSHAANALLKSLEEPPGDTVIVLVTAMPGRLMPTLRSRCRHVQVKPPSRGEALEWLQPRVGRQADALLDYAYGAPCAALAANEEDRLGQRQELVNAVLGISRGQLSALDAAKAVQALPDSQALDQLLALTARLSRMRLASSAADRAFEGDWQPVLARIDQRHLFRFADKLIHAKSLLLSGANPNKQLLWEELMLDWQALTHARSTGNPAKQLL